MLTFLAFIFIFSLVVFVHELGHFIAAKKLGVEVKTFAFGFPPKIWSKKIGETRYSINALPLGGYVSLRGENEAELSEEELLKESENKRSMLSKTPKELFLIFVAGVLMNFFLAVFLLWICFMIGTQAIYSGMWEHKGVVNNQKVVITEIEKDSPAEKVGLLSGDIIKKVDGKEVYLSDEVLSIIYPKVKDNIATANITIERNGELQEKTISTYKSKIISGNKEVEVSRVGIELQTQGVMKANPIYALGAAISETGKISRLTFFAITDLFRQLLVKFEISQDVTGPIGIVIATSYFAHMGFVSLLQFTAILSLSLAVFNILPIPALDGGHIAFTFIEMVTRRKFSLKTKNLIQVTGFSLLILLMITVTVKDFVSFDIWGSILDKIGG